MPCQRCGVCCTKHQARVTPEEIEHIMSFLGITSDDWKKSYEDPRWKYNDYGLIRHVNGACALLKYENGLAACAVYTVRPACCADWEPNRGKMECREGMRK